MDWAVEGPLGLAEGQVRRGVDRAEQQLREQAPHLAGGAVGGAVLVVEVVIGAILAVPSLAAVHTAASFWSGSDEADGEGAVSEPDAGVQQAEAP